MTNKVALSALSPLDGRYLDKTKILRSYFSEAALIKYRIKVEILYLIELTRFLDKEKISLSQEKKLLNWLDNLSFKDWEKVKRIEKRINHDNQAVVYFIEKELKRIGFANLSSWVHWGLTSNDINNLAYSLILKEFFKKTFLPLQKQLIKFLIDFAQKNKLIVMLGRTHGKVALPTTLGKEVVVYIAKAAYFLEKIEKLNLLGKLNGAVGNLNSQYLIFPDKNWLKFSNKFITSLGLSFELTSTQFRSGVSEVYLFDLSRQLNNVWLQMSRDFWFYISFDYFTQKVNEDEVGSSTMPHKVNPIDFENAEGNLQLANSLLLTFADKLSSTRLQRDLSDKTVERNLGVAFGHTLLAIQSLSKGLEKMNANKEYLKEEVKKHPEMLSEALQLVLKTWGKNQAYEKIKKQVRGQSEVVWEKLIKDLDESKKKEIVNWKLEKYYGSAGKIVSLETKRVKKLLKI